VAIIKTELSNEKQALQLKVEANAKLQENNEKMNLRVRQSASK